MVLNKILLEMTITKHVIVTTKCEAGEGRATKNGLNKWQVFNSVIIGACVLMRWLKNHSAKHLLKQVNPNG